MNVLFLDIDGVLVTMASLNRRVPIYDTYEKFQKSSVDLLVEIVKEYNFTVVLSSGWRLFYDTYNSVKRLLKQFDIEIYDSTPDLCVWDDRFLEIQEWLDQHPQVKNFVILDDIPMLELADHWVSTNLTQGLMPEHKERINEIMARAPKGE